MSVVVPPPAVIVIEDDNDPQFLSTDELKDKRMEQDCLIETGWFNFLARHNTSNKLFEQKASESGRLIKDAQGDQFVVARLEISAGNCTLVAADEPAKKRRKTEPGYNVKRVILVV